MASMDQAGKGNQRRSDDQRTHGAADLLGAREAAALLGVKLPTLYAYVSRGLLASLPTGGNAATHERRYARAEVLRLKERAAARAGHGPVAAGALHWGEPVLESALTAVDEGGPRYRGHSAVALARAGVPFEAVAELLWEARPAGTLPVQVPPWSPGPGSADAAALKLPWGGSPGFAGRGGRSPAEPPLIDRLAGMLVLVPVLGAADAGRFSAPREAEVARARGLLLHLAAGLDLGGPRFSRALSAGGVARAAATALGLPGSAEIEAALNRALVLMADHELNVSTFAARVAASAGADLYACVSAALCTLSGPRHGGACDRVEALVAEAGRARDAATVVRERLRRGEALPGFGHPLYPGGDPRTAPLLEAAQAVARRERPGLRALLALVAAMRDAGHPPPGVETGLVALALALGLPPGTATCLFAVGRCAGWVAHVLEQRDSPLPLRPKARYVGPPPVT